MLSRIEIATPAGSKATATAAWVASALVCASCAMQPDYMAPVQAAPSAWSALPPSPDFAAPLPDDQWWALLRDPAIDDLVAHAMVDSPSVAQAVARVDETRANLGIDAAQRLPAVSANAGATRSRSLGATSGVPSTSLDTTASAGLGLSWEIALAAIASAGQRIDSTREAAEAVQRAAGPTAITTESNAHVLSRLSTH